MICLKHLDQSKYPNYHCEYLLQACIHDLRLPFNYYSNTMICKVFVTYSGSEDGFRMRVHVSCVELEVLLVPGAGGRGHRAPGGEEQAGQHEASSRPAQPSPRLPGHSTGISYQFMSTDLCQICLRHIPGDLVSLSHIHSSDMTLLPMS
mgnify:FL=1